VSAVSVVAWCPDEKQNDDDDEQHDSVLAERQQPTLVEQPSQPGATIEPNRSEFARFGGADTADASAMNRARGRNV
jgi:nitrogen fixation-related uncharacterized protein